MLTFFDTKLNVKLSEADFDRCHRIGVSSSKKPRPIIVKFISYQDRYRIFKSKSRLKGSGITIKEDLTKFRYNLLQEAIKKFGGSNVWTSDGRIFVKQENGIVKISSVNDLRNIVKSG